MDPAQGETGGGKLSSKLKSKVPHSRVKDKVLGLKNRLPGMKKHGGEEDAHEDSSEYDETSPSGPGLETSYNVADSTPFTPGKATTDSSSPRFSPREVHFPDYDSKPAQTGYDSKPAQTGYDSKPAQTGYDSKPVQTGYDSKPAQTGYDSRPAQTGYDSGPAQTGYDSRPVQTGYDSRPVQTGYDSGPAQTGYDSRPVQTGYDSRPARTGYDSRPAQTGYDSQNTNYVAAAPPTRPAPMANDSPRSHLAPALEEKFQHLGVGHNPTSPHVDADLAATDRGVQPGQQFSSPYTTESVQKGHSDVPRNSFRSNTMPATAATNKGMLEKVKDSVVGATVVVGDKLGYYNDHNPADPNAPSFLSKAKSTLGVDKPRDPNAPPLTERAKAYMNVATQKTREYSSTAADHAAWTKDRVAAQTTPTHHDKALSEQVTQSLSSLPAAIKEKVFGPASPSSRGPNSPGIVDRVSGAVSSLFTAAPKDTGAHMQHTFPAHSHHDASSAAGATGLPSAPADRSSVPERMAATSTPEYATVNN